MASNVKLTFTPAADPPIVGRQGVLRTGSSRETGVATAPGGGGGGGGTGGTFIWGSAWINGTGSGNPAVMDGGKFTSRSGSNPTPLISVVSAAGLGFPAGMANVLKIHCGGASDLDDQIYTHGAFSDLPAVGEYSFFRMFYRLVAGANQDFDSFHPLHFGDGNHGPIDIEALRRWGTTSDGVNFQESFSPFHDNPAYPYNEAYFGGQLGGASHGLVGVTICQEFRFTRNSSTTVKVDFQQSRVDGSSRTGSSAWGQDGNAWTTGNPDVQFAASSFTDLVVGQNDYSSTANGIGDLYFGGLAIKKSTNANHWFTHVQDHGEVWA